MWAHGRSLFSLVMGLSIVLSPARAGDATASKPSAEAVLPRVDHFAAYVLPDGAVQISWISSVPMATGSLEMDAEGGFRVVGISSDKNIRNHCVRTEGLRPGDRVRVRVRAPMGGKREFVGEPVEVQVPAIPHRRAVEQSISLKVASPVLPERPLIVSLPLGRGQLWRSEDASVVAGDRPVATQGAVVSRWPDGSVRCLLASCLPGPGASDLKLALGASNGQSDNMFMILASDQGVTIDNGVLRMRMDRGAPALFQEVQSAGGAPWSGTPQLGNVRVLDGAGVAWGLGPTDRLELEEKGPIRAVLVAEGPLQSEQGERRFRYRMRYFLAARSPLARVQITLINDAMEPEFAELSSIALRIPLGGGGGLRGQLAGCEPVDVTEPDGNAIQQVTDRRLRVWAGGKVSDREERSPAWVVLERGSARMAFAFRDFWQTWPKGLALKPDGLHVRVLPQLAADEYKASDLHDWLRHVYWFSKGKYLFKRGMALRIEFHVRFDRASEPVPEGGWDAWARAIASLPYAAPGPEHCCATGAFGPVAAAAVDQNAAYESLIDRAVESRSRGREELGEYGWMNFGDWYGERQFNWGNNEYDWPGGMAVQFARSGRWEDLASGEWMARHYATIDTIHVPWKAGMAGRVYAHSTGHVGLAQDPPVEFQNADWKKYCSARYTFRTGGIDVGGHVFEEGNFGMYLLTGDRDLLETAEMVAFAQARYLTPRFDFTIERGAGWPLVNAVAAYETTGNPLYLNAARIYIERILAKQDAESGGWMLPQDPSECDHPPPHLGGKAFATGVLLYGMMRYDLVEPTPEVKRSIVRACEWLVEKAWNREKQGFRYKTGCDKYADTADTGTTAGLCSAGLAYGWKLSHDPRFAEVLAVSFEKMCGHASKLGKGAAMVVRQSACALPVLREIRAAGTKPQ